MNWIHIMERQPENDEWIIHLDPPWNADDQNRWLIGMRQFKIYGTWEDYIKWHRKDALCPDPNFYWISAKDFPFPKIK